MTVDFGHFNVFYLCLFISVVIFVVYNVGKKLIKAYVYCLYARLKIILLYLYVCMYVYMYYRFQRSILL
jgi:hypothetical protein